MCWTVVVWFMEGIWERFPFTMIKTPWLRRLALFFGIIAISGARCRFFWYMQGLVWGDASRGHRRVAAPDWRWLHVGETAIFFLVPALFLQFYCGNFFDGSSVGKTGKPLRYRESVALETQKYPDSPNHPAFPSTTLRPGGTYPHTCIYRLGAQ